VNTARPATLKPPLSPYLVLLTSILLPGMGQVLNNTPVRGLSMVMFATILGLITYQLADPKVSAVGHFAGGLFIYAISIMDAYHWARVRCALFQGS
jgi:hypothetical protein